MKKTIILLLLVSGIATAQEKEFTFDNIKGMSDFIVTNVDSKTAPEIYKKVIEWIKVTYKNPDKVILSTIDNEYVRFEGSSDYLWCINSLGLKTCYLTKYQIEISMKDGRYKFDLIGLEYYINPSQYSRGGWNDASFFSKPSTPEQLTGIYKKDGSLRSAFKDVQDIPLYFNNLNKALFEFINSQSPAKGDW